MTQNRLIGRSHSRKHYHEQSMDDFMKNIRKFNLRSQRYISSKPFNMYLKNNTTKTMQKSRSHTLSNRKSMSKSKKMGKRIQTLLSQQTKQKSKIKIKNGLNESFDQNIGQLIQQFSERIKKVQSYIGNKNKIGSILCNKFKQMLNKIIQTTIIQINESIKQVEKRTIKKIQKQYQNKLRKIKNYNKKLQLKTKQLIQRLQNNSNLIYHLRMDYNIDIDYVFGITTLGTDKCGGRGYKQQLSQNIQQNEHEFLQNYIQDRIQESGRIRPAHLWQKQAYEENIQRVLQIQRKSL